MQLPTLRFWLGKYKRADSADANMHVLLSKRTFYYKQRKNCYSILHSVSWHVSDNFWYFWFTSLGIFFAGFYATVYTSTIQIMFLNLNATTGQEEQYRFHGAIFAGFDFLERDPLVRWSVAKTMQWAITLCYLGVTISEYIITHS